MSALRIAVVVGSTSERSRTQVLAQALVEAIDRALPAQQNGSDVRGPDVRGSQGRGPAPRRLDPQWLNLHRLAPHLAVAASPRDLPPEGTAAVRAIESADLVVAASPVYKGSYTGLFKHLFDLVGPDALVGRPVLLAANGGSDRHALVVDHQLRPLFAFFRALTVPSAVYASEADFDGYTLRSQALRARIDEAAQQAVQLLVPPGRPGRQGVPLPTWNEGLATV